MLTTSLSADFLHLTSIDPVKQVHFVFVMEVGGELKFRGRSSIAASEDSSSYGSPRSASPSSDGSETKRPTAAMTKGKSLKDRSKIPYSFAVTFGTILGLQYAAGVWSEESIRSWGDSLRQSSVRLVEMARYPMDLFLGGKYDKVTGWHYGQTAFLAAFALFLFYVFFVAPAMKGLWTGSGNGKKSRAMFHRYSGLTYLIHYVLAGVEMATLYESSGKTSLLTHIVAVIGAFQCLSCFPSSHTPHSHTCRCLARNISILHVQSAPRVDGSWVLLG